MNSNCLTVIVKAMRRIGVIASGQLPTIDEQNDGLETLRAVLRRFITGGAFSEIEEASVNEAGEYDARPNTRIYVRVPNVNVALPSDAPITTVAYDDYGLKPRNRNRNVVQDCAVIIVVDEPHNITREYIFDRTTKKWADIAALELSSECPLSQRDLIGLSCALAIELAPEYGQAAQVDDSTQLAAMRFHSDLTHNWTDPDRERGNRADYY